MVRYSLFALVVVLLCVPERAFSQWSAPLARGTGNTSNGTGGRAPAGAGMQPGNAPQPGAPSPVGPPGFAQRLGNTVGLQAPPAVGNINQPGSSAGMQPLPTRVGAFPAGPAGYPNINSPGGTPGMNSGPSMPPRWGNPWDGRSPGRDHGSFGKTSPAPNVVFYGIPYYVPYVVYAPDPTLTSAQEKPVDPGLYGSGITVSAPPPQPAPAPSVVNTITLLAFKDHTVVAVVDYWLEGDQVCYSTGSGLRTCIPLDQLDFPLTQQLNRERNVRFVLEARPY